MSMECKVTVICLCYNQAAYIRDALEGFAMQKTSFPFEVLVHDDASTDGTAGIVREYAERYPGIIVPVLQTENQYSKGVSISRTFLYPLVRGEYVALCEGDDFWTDPLKLQKQADALDAHPEVDICAHRALVITDRPEGFVAPDLRTRVLSADEVIAGGGGYVATASLMVRREAYMKQTPMREICTMDYVLQMQASLRGGMLYLEDCMSVYRKGVPGSWSSTQRGGAAPAELQARILDALDEYTGGAHHKAVDLRKRINRSKELLRRRRLLSMIAPGEIGITLKRIGRSFRRLRIKLHYAHSYKDIPSSV